MAIMKDDLASIRFWSKVNRTDGCWEWIGAKTNKGYGSTWHQGRREDTHRIAWRLVNGPIPEGMWVLHKCDNPPCVRPDHLYLGDIHQNARDAMERGRTARGERLPSGRRTHCPKGHPYDANRRCRICMAEATKRWREKHREEALAKEREYKKRPEVRQRETERQRERRAQDPEAYRAYMREWYWKNRRKKTPDLCVTQDSSEAVRDVQAKR